MKKIEDSIDFPTLQAAVAGESWAVSRVAEHYSEYINRLSTENKRQPDGSIKKVINEDLRQSLYLKLLESLPNFKYEGLI